MYFFISLKRKNPPILSLFLYWILSEALTAIKSIGKIKGSEISFQWLILWLFFKSFNKNKRKFLQKYFNIFLGNFFGFFLNLLWKENKKMMNFSFQNQKFLNSFESLEIISMARKRKKATENMNEQQISQRKQC